MTWGQPLGLDELMIINPGLPSSETYFLGDDGTVYQLQEIDDEFPGIGELFLSDDGILYQLQSYRLPNQKRRRRKSSTCRCRRKSY
ncbi:MAG: hypothetical protein F6K18_04645 [Okeania sp. SIO2C2]|uniref:hypothetical protein n=1 Tax=Okeania sp. SIO2C2 TaxID=2607787 RepID=UPI0013BB554F|nr:hypothetical protein [Okeania sp. SIO2C2]NEP86163.1 hypothetical protein [Okeania sp. SIO2C2]